MELRIEFIDPCFAIFYNCQLKVYEALYKELRVLADANFDMSCSAMNGFVAKWQEASELSDQLTIPKKSSNAQQSVITSHSDLKGTNLEKGNSSSSIKNSASLATMGGMSAALPNASELKKYVIALYDFDAQADGDLTFRRDDKIEVVEKTENQNDWWIGKINGITGQFPGNYVAEI